MSKSSTAAIYIRVSSERQAEGERTSPESQEADCMALCERLGLEVFEVIRDVERYKSHGRLVEPGGERADRPGWVRLLKLVSEGDVSHIVAWDASRLIRGMRPAVDLDDSLTANPDARIELVRGTLERSTIGLWAWLGQQERQNIAERTARGRAAGLEKGHLPGGPLVFGYERSEENQPVVNSTEARGVRLVLEEYAKGTTHHEIRRLLDASGIPPRKGGAWSVASVRNIIYDAESYASGERTTSLDGQDYTISYPPIISPVLAAKCARRIRKNKKSLGTRRRSGLHLLRGLITCPCGWTWTVRNDRRWPNASTYRCQRRDHGKPQSENCPNAIPVRLLDPVVWGEVQALVLNPDRLHELIAERTTADTQAIDELEEELTRLDERLQSLDKERTWILDTAQAELLAPADLRTRLEQHQSKTDVIASQRQELAGRLSIVRGNLSAVDAASEVIGQEASRLAPLSVDLSEDAPWLAIPPEVAAVAPWELSSREGGLYVRRSTVARALGTKSNIEDMRHAQAAGRRQLIEQFVESVHVLKDNSERGWTCRVQLVFHSSGALDMYSSDWCLK